MKRPDHDDQRLAYFVSPEPGATNGVQPARPLGTLEEALAAVGRRARAANGRQTARADSDVEIVCGQPGAGGRSRRRPRYHFFVDLAGEGSGGDGTELQPFRDVHSAIEGIAQLRHSGRLELRPGDRIRLSPHRVFAPSRLENWRETKETIAKYIFLAMTMSLVLPVVAILGYLLIRAWPVLTPAFFLENPKNYMTSGGIWAPLVGTFFLVAISLLVAAPIGVLSGVYLNEYARDNWLTRLINLAVVNLAGVPSIVHALFGVGAFVLFAGMGRSVLAASCTLAVMTLPVIITSTREALASVPMAFREACWNMGATRWQTIRTIVLPNSISGILTGVILQVSRAAGETAPILFTGAVFYVPVPDHGWTSFFPYGLGDRCMALSMHLFTLATQVRGVSEETQYGTAVVLIGLVLIVNSVSIGVRSYLRSRKKW
ncbi:MAG: phosphate ABC transporter permease PstA [Pirellulales bacterium]|nr:phosphate ABC transporter permease PstA [Pirellulales bacterium]